MLLDKLFNVKGLNFLLNVFICNSILKEMNNFNKVTITVTCRSTRKNVHNGILDDNTCRYEKGKLISGKIFGVSLN